VVTHSARTRTFATNSLFGTFFLSALGWGILQNWAAGIGAGGILHALIALPCLTMIGVVLYRYSRHWPSSQFLGKTQQASSPQLFVYSTLIWCLILAAAGVGIGIVVSWGSFSAASLAAMVVVATPWTRIPACRDNFFVAAAALGAGAAAGLILFGEPIFPFYYPLVGSAILLASCCTVLFMLMAHGNRYDRMPESGY